MDGAPPDVRRCAGVIASITAAAIVLAIPGAGAQPLSVRGSCRDGLPHGAWQLKAPNGSLRALGAFNHGKRTSSFIFWNAAGVRIAHVPYEEGERNGTLAIWRDRPVKDGEGPQRLEAVYAMGKLNGIKRVWHADGRLRGEYAYVAAALVDAKGWDTRGRALAPQAARAQAERDYADDEAFLASLDAQVAANTPDCRNGGNGAATTK